jgi:hypothetical protein
LESEALPI